MFDRIVRRFLDHTFDPRPRVLTATKKITYFASHSQGYILYRYALKSTDSATPLLDFFSFFRFFFVFFVFRFSFFPFKDKVPKYLRSSVVYLFKCRCCSNFASYVGQTTRHLHTRISEHLGISPITGKHSTNPAMSSILSHVNASRHPANFDDFQILSSSSDSYKLMIHESLLINKYKPNLNVQGSSIPLNLF